MCYLKEQIYKRKIFGFKLLIRQRHYSADVIVYVFILLSMSLFYNYKEILKEIHNYFIMELFSKLTYPIEKLNNRVDISNRKYSVVTFIH